MANNRLAKAKKIAFTSTTILARCLIIALGWSIFFAPTNVSADYNDLPSYLNETYDQYISSKPEDSVTRKGNFTPSLQFMIYTPYNSETNYVDIVKGAAELSDYPRCSDFLTMKAYAVTADANSDGKTLIGTQGVNLDCDPISDGFRLSGLKNTFKYRCSARLSANSSCSASPSYSVIAVRITVKANTSVFADVQASSNSRLSYVGDNNIPSEGPNTYTGVSKSLPEGGGNLISSEFSPPCNYSGGRAYVYWKDADSSEPPNGGEQVKFYLYEQGKSTPLDEGEAYGDGEIHHTSFVPKKGKHYRIVFSPVRKRNVSQNIASNTIKIWPPFDSAQPRCVNPTGTGDATCTNWSKDITDHSLWRISVFSVGSEPTIRASGNNAVNDGVTPPYPSGEGGHTGAAIDQWAKFKNLPTPVVYDESPSHDYTLTHNFQPPSSSGWYVFTEHWFHQSNGNWQYFYDALPFQANCYAASCTMTVDGNLPNGSSNVQAGSYNWGATAYVTNTGRQPLQMSGDTIPAGASGYPVDIDAPQAPTSQGYYANYVGGSVAAAPWGPSYAVASCSAGVNAYQHFTLVPTAGISASTDSQDPKAVTYDTHVNYGPDQYPYPYAGPIASNVHSKLNYDPVSGPSSQVMNVNRSGSYGSADYSDTYINPNPIIAGDQYCPSLTIDTAKGWIGPGGILYPESDTAPGGCMTVVNKPYFKVYGSGISAGGGFCRADGSCPGGASARGEISSWNNNSGTYPFGAGSQIAALTDGQITGFGSGQTTPPTINDRGTNLSFSNRVTGTTSQDAYNPKQGGSFGAYNPSTPIELDNPEVQAGGYVLAGRTVSSNQAIQVNGDVFINDNITFGGGGVKWDSGNVPSFVLKATGNIYINSSVTRLDGIYTTTKKNGVIYTCAKASGAGFAPVRGDTDAYYDTCKRQLVVRGSFIADKIALMRTFGSLRDEKFTPPVTTTTAATSGVTGSMVWTEAASPTANGLPQTGSSPSDYLKPANGRYTDSMGRQCTSFAEGAEPASNYWYDNFLCLSKADTDAGIRIVMDQNSSNEASARTHTGLAYCDSINDAVSDAVHTWTDNYLCSSLPVSVQRGNSANNLGGIPQSCTSISETADADNSRWRDGNTYVCIARATSTTTVVTPASPATFPRTCSNGTVQARTCAAEIFDFSPEFYLSKPKIKLPSGGALQFDAITSLPPVL